MPKTISLKLMMPGTTRVMPSPVGSSWLFGGLGPMMQKIVKMASMLSDVPDGVAVMRILIAPPHQLGGSAVFAPGAGKLWTTRQPKAGYPRTSVAAHHPPPSPDPREAEAVNSPPPGAP